MFSVVYEYESSNRRDTCTAVNALRMLQTKWNHMEMENGM